MQCAVPTGSQIAGDVGEKCILTRHYPIYRLENTGQKVLGSGTGRAQRLCLQTCVADVEETGGVTTDSNYASAVHSGHRDVRTWTGL